MLLMVLVSAYWQLQLFHVALGLTAPVIISWPQWTTWYVPINTCMIQKKKKSQCSGLKSRRITLKMPPNDWKPCFYFQHAVIFFFFFFWSSDPNHDKVRLDLRNTPQLSLGCITPDDTNFPLTRLYVQALYIYICFCQLNHFICPRPEPDWDTCGGSFWQ